MDAELRKYFGRHLRRLYQRSPIKRMAKQALKDACAECGIFGVDLELDHANPVVPPDRPVGALEYFMRMFCFNESGELSLDNLVKLCVPCHQRKSAGEMAIRASLRQGPYSAEAQAKRKATLLRNRLKKRAKFKKRKSRK